MSAVINGTSIGLTRGDTLSITLTILDTDGETYTPAAGDRIRFKMKRDYCDAETLIEKQIDTSGMVLQIDPADTSPLDFGEYVYDVQLTTASGVVDTVIPRGKFKILAEVD